MIPEEKSREQKKTLVWIKRDQCARAISGFVATVSSLCHVLAFVSRRESGGRGKDQKRPRSRKRKSREKEGRSQGAFKDQFPLSVHRRCPASSNSLFNLQSCLPFVLQVHPPLLRRRTPPLPFFPLPFFLSVQPVSFHGGLSIRFAPMAWLNGADRNSGGVAEAGIERNSPLERDKAWRR